MQAPEILNEDERRRQRIVVVLFFFLSGLLTAAWASRIPDIQQKLGLSVAGLGTVLAAIPAGLVTGLSIAPWLVASFGNRRVLALSCLASALFLVLAGLAPGKLVLFIALFFLGIGRTVFNLAANAAALDVQRHYSRPILASFHGLWSVACFASAGLGTVMIIADVAPALHFGGVSLLSAAMAGILLRWPFGSALTPEKRPFFVKPDRYLFLLGLIALCAMLCEGAMFDWAVNYFDKVVAVPRSLVTVGYTAFIVAMSLGRLVGDRFIASRGAFAMLRINGLLMTVGFALAALAPSLVPAALAFLLIGAGDSILVPVVYMLAAQSKKMPSTYALSAVTLIGYSGFLIGPLFIGNVSQRWGMPVAFLCLSGVSLLMIFLAMRVRKLG